MSGDSAHPSSGAGSGSGNSATPSGENGHQSIPDRLDRACREALLAVGVDGAGITVMGRIDGARDQVAATGALTRRLEELQLTAGEGPCVEAYASGVPVLAGDLGADSGRWPGFAPDAIAAGAAAVFSLPLQVGAIGLGTFDLHRMRAEGLSREQLAAALALAEVATEALLEEAGTPAGDDVGWLPGVHADVHVASGMVAVQTGVDVGTALLRLRGHAFAHGEALHEVARRVIEHTLVLGSAEDTADDYSRTSTDDGHFPDPEDR